MSSRRLLGMYNGELEYIRKLAEGFQEKHPDVAAGLLLEPTKCEDPHVERLIEAFAMIAARTRMRIEDDFSEITDALLGVVYPHYLAPVPSIGIVQLEVDPAVPPPPGGVHVPRHTTLRSRTDRNVRVACRFRTAYPLDLYPLSIRDVEIVPANALGVPLDPEVRSAVRISLELPEGADLAELGIDKLRFFVPGESDSAHPLYELLLRNPLGVVVECSADGEEGPQRRSAILDSDAVAPVGFGLDEGLLEYPPESFLGYRLIQEYFAFQEKFWFVEIRDLDRVTPPEGARQLHISVLLGASAADLDVRLSPTSLELGCTPAVNLFEMDCDPIHLQHTAEEYEVHPDRRFQDSYEVYRVLEVRAGQAAAASGRSFEPFYAVRHGDDRSRAPAYHNAVRREIEDRDYDGTNVFLRLVDPEFDPYEDEVDRLDVRVLATNRALPARLSFGSASGDFEVEGYPDVWRARCRRNPTPPLEAPIAQGSRWRIISHLALNHLSITGSGSEAGAGLEALREILKLYDFADSPSTQNRIRGLVGLQSKPVPRRIGLGADAAFLRGVEIQLDFDANTYTGAGMFLLASALERFLALYTSINSFTQTVACVAGREGVFKRWPPRAGESPLV